MTSLFDDEPPQRPLVSDVRHALEGRVARAKTLLRNLPRDEQERLSQVSREKGPAMFALIGRLSADPVARELVETAVLRTRERPTDAELNRAVARLYKSALRAGDTRFRAAACHVLERLESEFGTDNAYRVTLAQLQRGYLAVTAKGELADCDGAAEVMTVTTAAALWVLVERAEATAAPAAPAAGPALAPVDVEDVNAPVEERFLAAGLMAACLHIASGVRGLQDLGEALVQDLGEAFRPCVRGFYEAIRHYPDLDIARVGATATRH